MRVADKTVERSIVAETSDYRGNDGVLHCGICHEAKEAFYPAGMEWLGKKKHPRMCACYREECEQEEKRVRQTEHELFVERLRANCFSASHMYRWCFRNDNGRNPKIKIAKEYVDAWEENEKGNRGLLFWGGVGTGKSFMAGCIANELLEIEISVRMTNFAEILNELNCSDTDRNAYIQKLCKFRLLIIDDLGMERGTDYGMEQVYNVIDARYRSGKPLIVTTNLSLQEMKNETNLARKRIYDRILTMCIPVQIQGTNMRQEEQWEKFRGFSKSIGLFQKQDS